MGDMADFALDHSWSEVEHYERYKDAPLDVQYEEGIIDEYGLTIGNPSSLPMAAKPTSGTSASNCRMCGSVAVNRTGPHGVFTGCSTFPKCKWSESR